jgi:hypothetical protein
MGFKNDYKAVRKGYNLWKKNSFILTLYFFSYTKKSKRILLKLKNVKLQSTPDIRYPQYKIRPGAIFGGILYRELTVFCATLYFSIVIF